LTSDDLENNPQWHLQTGDDTINGGDGSDVITDFYGSNTLSGGNGDDEIFARDPFEDNAPDVVDGGAGYDFISVDDGDTVTSGEDPDHISVTRIDHSDDNAVVVTDLNKDEDTVVIYFDHYENGDQHIVFRGDATYTEQENGVMVSRDDVDLVFFEGVSVSDVRAALPVGGAPF
jgi:hypothetical protein